MQARVAVTIQLIVYTIKLALLKAMLRLQHPRSSRNSIVMQLSPFQMTNGVSLLSFSLRTFDVKATVTSSPI